MSSVTDSLRLVIVLAALVTTVAPEELCKYDELSIIYEFQWKDSHFPDEIASSGHSRRARKKTRGRRAFGPVRMYSGRLATMKSPLVLCIWLIDGLHAKLSPQTTSLHHRVCGHVLVVFFLSQCLNLC